MKPHISTLVFWAACMAPGALWAQATACMVLGAKDAVVSTPQGDKSPVFMATDCAALKLQKGQAQASWIGRDGKPRLVPITNAGVSAVPSAGSEERSVNVVWSELTSQRERQQPAYMRNLGEQRAPKVYVPEQGLELVPSADSEAILSVWLVQEGGNQLLQRTTVAAGTPVVLPREGLKPEQTYAIHIQRGDLVEEWRWSLVAQAQQDTLDSHLRTIKQEVAAAPQQSMLKAMLYEQLKMRVNMDFEVQHLRATGAVN